MNADKVVILLRCDPGFRCTLGVPKWWSRCEEGCLRGRSASDLSMDESDVVAGCLGRSRASCGRLGSPHLAPPARTACARSAGWLRTGGGCVVRCVAVYFGESPRLGTPGVPGDRCPAGAMPWSSSTPPAHARRQVGRIRGDVDPLDGLPGRFFRAVPRRCSCPVGGRAELAHRPYGTQGLAPEPVSCSRWRPADRSRTGDRRDPPPRPAARSKPVHVLVGTRGRRGRCRGGVWGAVGGGLSRVPHGC